MEFNIKCWPIKHLPFPQIFSITVQAHNSLRALLCQSGQFLLKSLNFFTFTLTAKMLTMLLKPCLLVYTQLMWNSNNCNEEMLLPNVTVKCLLTKYFICFAPKMAAPAIQYPFILTTALLNILWLVQSMPTLFKKRLWSLFIQIKLLGHLVIPQSCLDLDQSVFVA